MFLVLINLFNITYVAYDMCRSSVWWSSRWSKQNFKLIWMDGKHERLILNMFYTVYLVQPKSVIGGISKLWEPW